MFVRLFWTLLRNRVVRELGSWLTRFFSLLNFSLSNYLTTFLIFFIIRIFGLDSDIMVVILLTRRRRRNSFEATGIKKEIVMAITPNLTLAIPSNPPCSRISSIQHLPSQFPHPLKCFLPDFPVSLPYTAAASDNALSAIQDSGVIACLRADW